MNQTELLRTYKYNCEEQATAAPVMIYPTYLQTKLDDAKAEAVLSVQIWLAPDALGDQTKGLCGLPLRSEAWENK